MTVTYPFNQLAHLKPGDHLCSLYEQEEEQAALFTSFLRQGLNQGEKGVYIVDAHTAEEVTNHLRVNGLKAEPYLEKGQLRILPAEATYVKEGVFDPDEMINTLRSETINALEEGYTALRVTGEMTWALRGLQGSERLIEYEAKLNEFFPGSKCLALCQYDRRRFKPELLLDVMVTHPIVAFGAEVYTNPYYIQPENMLGTGFHAATLQHWLKTLASQPYQLGDIIVNKREDSISQAGKHAELVRGILKRHGILIRKITVVDEPEKPLAAVFEIICREVLEKNRKKAD